MFCIAQTKDCFVSRAFAYLELQFRREQLIIWFLYCLGWQQTHFWEIRFSIILHSFLLKFKASELNSNISIKRRKKFQRKRLFNFQICFPLTLESKVPELLHWNRFYRHFNYVNYRLYLRWPRKIAFSEQLWTLILTNSNFSFFSNAHYGGQNEHKNKKKTQTTNIKRVKLTVLLPKFRTLQLKYADFPTSAVTFFCIIASKYGSLHFGLNTEYCVVVDTVVVSTSELKPSIGPWKPPLVKSVENKQIYFNMDGRC